MRQQLTTIALLPLLLAQGIQVRRRTPLLPEAAGPRNGEEGSGPLLRLLIAGDSAAAGVGVVHQQQALAGRLCAELANDHRVRWNLVAATGLGAGSLAERLQQAASGTYDVALISVGVNDVTSGITRRRWLQQLERLRRTLQTRQQVRLLVFTRIPPMQHFPALPPLLARTLGTRAARFNDAMQDYVEDRPGCTLLYWDLPLDSSHIAADGFHPAGPAYRSWGRLGAAHIRDLLATAGGD